MQELDISHTILAKSDQLNADDLIGNEMVLLVTGVKLAGSDDQPQVGVPSSSRNPRQQEIVEGRSHKHGFIELQGPHRYGRSVDQPSCRRNRLGRRGRHRNF